MARKRMIDPRIWESEQVQELTSTQFKLYVYLISNADDEGRFKVSEKMIASKAFPMDEDYTSDSCGEDLEAVVSSGLVEIYEVDGKRYGHHPNWLSYQYIQKKQESTIPSPEEGIPVSYQYRTAIVPVTPNRIEKKRIEKNRTSTVPEPENQPQELPEEPEKMPPAEAKPPVRKKGKAPKGEGKTETDPLYHSIKDAFLSANDGKFTNWGKEGKAIHGLIDKATRASPEDPEGHIRQMMGCLWELKTGGDRFYQDQPFTPSTLNASGIWDRVAEKLKIRGSEIQELEEYRKIMRETGIFQPTEAWA